MDNKALFLYIKIYTDIFCIGGKLSIHLKQKTIDLSPSSTILVTPLDAKTTCLVFLYLEGNSADRFEKHSNGVCRWLLSCMAVLLTREISTANLTLFGTIQSWNIGKKSAKEKNHAATQQIWKLVESQALFLPFNILILHNPYNLSSVVLSFPFIIAKLNLILDNLCMVT